MNVILRPEHEHLITEAIRSGAYENTDQVLERALQLFRDEEERLQESRSDISQRIEEAMAQFDRGEFLNGDEARAEMERRKAEWIAKRK